MHVYFLGDLSFLAMLSELGPVVLSGVLSAVPFVLCISLVFSSTVSLCYFSSWRRTVKEDEHFFGKRDC